MIWGWMTWIAVMLDAIIVKFSGRPVESTPSLPASAKAGHHHGCGRALPAQARLSRPHPRPGCRDAAYARMRIAYPERPNQAAST